MLKRVLRRMLYFGIPVAMWLTGVACEDAAVVQHQQAQYNNVTYRCSRIGCGKSTVAAANAPAPVCSCGSPMVLDQGEQDTFRLKK